MSASTPALVLHGTELSGHSRRVENLLHMLGLPCRFADSPREVRASPAFRALNPIADLACHPYVAHAPEGGISLEPYPAARARVAVEALPRFRPMPRSAVPAGLEATR